MAAGAAAYHYLQQAAGKTVLVEVQDANGDPALAEQAANEAVAATASGAAGYIAYATAMGGGGAFKSRLSPAQAKVHARYLARLSNAQIYHNAGRLFAGSPQADYRAAGRSALSRAYSNRNY
jgi:hypothetical protein